HQNKKIINNIAGIKKQKSSDVNVILAELPLDMLNSGNYLLNVEVRNKSNELIASKQSFFQRNKPVEPVSLSNISALETDNTFVSYMDKSTLRESIATLYPISGRIESASAENQLAADDSISMQKYFYYFWSKRDAQNPEQAWLDYKSEV